MRHPLPHYSETIQKWITDQQNKRFNHPLTDEEIWVHITMLWPTFPPCEKHTIFHTATSRRYTPSCYSPTSSLSLQSRLSSSELPTTFSKSKKPKRRKP